MKRFVEGNDAFFNQIKKKVHGDVCYAFRNCELPACCNKRKCRIGIEKSHGAYVLMIDAGISCRKKRGGIELTLFKQFLSDGQLIFLDFNDVKEFLRSLSFLYR